MLSPCRQLKLTNLMTHTDANKITNAHMKKCLEKGLVTNSHLKKQHHVLNQLQEKLEKKNKCKQKLQSSLLMLTDRKGNKNTKTLTFRKKSYKQKKLSQFQNTKSKITLLSTLNHNKLEQDKKKLQEGKHCRIIILYQNEQIQHFLEVQSITSVFQYLKKEYPQIFYYKSIPTQVTLDYLLKQSQFSGEFLNGQTLYLKPGYQIENIHKNISLDSFQIIKLIGCGGFSKVFLCRFYGDGNFYAMKVIDKQVILKNKKKKIVMNERNIMKKMKHPFIIQMKFAFQTEKYLVFVMEYCVGGELFGLIKQYRRISEDIARFYIIEIFLAIAHLHHNEVIYRDIKPQNILLARDGHIKVADLGLAKPNMFDGQLAYSFCGSPQYMSPEMILQVGHTYPVDFYCMGALLYELVTGLPPFYSREPNQIYESVLQQQLTFPQDLDLSSSCKSLLRSLLCKEAKHRLGSLHGVKQILAHPWFGKNNYVNYLQKKIQPPILFNSLNKINLEPQVSENKPVEELQRDQKFMNTNFKNYMKKFYYDYKQNNQKNIDLHNKQKNKQNKPHSLNERSISKKSMKNLKQINSNSNILKNNSQQILGKVIMNTYRK